MPQAEADCMEHEDGREVSERPEDIAFTAVVGIAFATGRRVTTGSFVVFTTVPSRADCDFGDVGSSPTCRRQDFPLLSDWMGHISMRPKDTAREPEDDNKGGASLSEVGAAFGLASSGRAPS